MMLLRSSNELLRALQQMRLLPEDDRNRDVEEEIDAVIGIILNLVQIYGHIGYHQLQQMNGVNPS